MMPQFKKTPKQAELTRLAGTPATHIMAYGGSRSGKTFDHVRRLFIRAAKVKSRHVILRLKFNHVKTSVWLDTMPKVHQLVFPHCGAVAKASDFYYLFPNGSEIWIGGLDDKERTEKILGKEYSTMYFNECSQIPYNSISMAMTRLAEKNTLAKKAYYDMNPPSKAHWAYHLFEKHYDPMAEEYVDPDDYVSILMNPKDNLQNIDENYLKLLSKLPEKDRQRFLNGEFQESDDGQVYYEFKRENHVKSVSRTYGTVFVGMDFNVNPMTAVAFQMIDNKFVVFDEVFLNNSDTFKMCKELRDRGLTGARIIPDSTAKNRKTSGKSDIEILKQAGFHVEQTRNPYVFDRVNNTNRLLSANRILIDPKCKKLIKDLEQVNWIDGKLNQKGEASELTHISDAFGYGLYKLEPIGYNGTSNAGIRMR